MSLERKLERLIEMAWKVIESGFDQSAFVKWRHQAFECIQSLVGSDHPYTVHFRSFAENAERQSVLAGNGLLVAVKEHAATRKTILRDRHGPLRWSREHGTRRVTGRDGRTPQLRRPEPIFGT
ncbi:MAG: hypothetical protein AB1733_23585 [Thermodesulfobacteriota bacterium]